MNDGHCPMNHKEVRDKVPSSLSQYGQAASLDSAAWCEGKMQFLLLKSFCFILHSSAAKSWLK